MGLMSSLPLLPLLPLATAVLAMSEAERTQGYLCRVIGVTGFGGRRDGEAILISADPKRADEFSVVGSLLGGSSNTRILEAVAVLSSDLDGPPRRSGTIRVPISDDAAVSAGLACGGTAEILLEPLEFVPMGFWVALAARARIGLVSLLPATSDPSPTLSRVSEIDSMEQRCVLVSEAMVSTLPESVAKMVGDQMRRGTVRAQIIESDGARWFCEVVSPLPHVGVIGVSELASAITRQVALLGWTTTVIDERTETGLVDCLAVAQSLGTTDALVVLSHDLEASCGALHAAANESLGSPYLGALGSRHTQAARADWLRANHGWTEVSLESIHGPVGLDIGSRTPEETALAIVAEIVAHQRNRTATSLRGSAGPISTS
jgi:xanthine dehydrogenase accessory factor